MLGGVLFVASWREEDKPPFSCNAIACEDSRESRGGGNMKRNRTCFRRIAIFYSCSKPE